MKKFSFKFETVLRVKEKKEEELKRALMRLQALRIEQEQLLEKIDNEKRRVYGAKAAEKQGGVDIMSLVNYEAYLNNLRRKISAAEKKIKELEKKADDKRVEVIEASKEKKIFEKLKEKHFSEFKKTIVSNEQKQLDEIAVNKYNRDEQRTY